MDEQLEEWKNEVRFCQYTRTYKLNPWRWSNMFIRNVGIRLQHYRVPQPIRPLLWEYENLYKYNFVFQGFQFTCNRCAAEPTNFPLTETGDSLSGSKSLTTFFLRTWGYCALWLLVNFLQLLVSLLSHTFIIVDLIPNEVMPVVGISVRDMHLSHTKQYFSFA